MCDADGFICVSRLEEKADGGESGIRTHGALPHDGFQDRSVMTASVSLHRRLVTMTILSYQNPIVKGVAGLFLIFL